MKYLLFAALVQVGNLPAWNHLDTEVSTNVPYLFAQPNASELRLSLAAHVTPSNAVAVAFGTDEDADGNLSCDETLALVGWDCGVWFSRGIEWTKESSVPEDDDRQRKNFSLRLNGTVLDWNLFKVITRGVDAADPEVWAGTYAEGLKLIMR